MEDEKYVLLDTSAFDNAIAFRDKFQRDYQIIDSLFDKTVSELMVNWKGRGAQAFFKDVSTVRRNLSAIFDMLKIMCDTLEDCKAVFSECDKALREFNENPAGQDN